MRPTARVLCAALLGATLAPAFAGPARADELYAAVERTAAPGERALVKVRSDAAGPVTLVLFRVEDPAALLEAGLDVTHGETAYPRLFGSMTEALKAAGPRAPAASAVPGPARGEGVPAGPLSARLSFISTTAATLPAPKDGKSEATVEVALPASGLYLVEVRGTAGAALVFALSSRLALVTKRDPARMLAWAVDRTTGAPIEDVAVEARAAGKPAGSGRTGKDGILVLPLAGPPTVEVRAVRGDDWAFGSEAYFPAGVSDRRVHAFTHQPAYRPGERVEAKGIVRGVRDGESVLDPDVREAIVHFVAAGPRELGVVHVPVSADLGTFAAGLTLPADAPTGDASLVVEVGGKSYAAPFRIEEYRRPTFEVLVKSTPERAYPGQDLAYAVSAEFFEGGPVSGAKVQWSLAYHRVDRDLFPADEMARLFFGTEREAYAPRPLGQGEVTLDAGGRATVAVKAPEETEDGFLTLSATVTGPDRTAAVGSGGTALHVQPLTVALRADKHLYGAEGVAHVTIRAVGADGGPAAGRKGILTAALVSQGPRGGPVREEERQVSSAGFQTGADGSAALDVPFPENGRYALSVAIPRQAPEPEGAPASALLHVWVAGDRAEAGFSGDRLEVVADKDTYEVGDTARLLVLSPAGGRPFLETVEGSRLASWSAVALPGADDRGSSAVVSVPITDALVPNGFLGVCVVDHGNLMTTAKLLRVPPVARILVPRVTAAKADFEPGETVSMKVSVADHAGRPAAGAEVAVAIVDDSLYALYSDPSAALEPFFHPLRRDDVRTGGPLHLFSTTWILGPPPRTSREEPGADAGPARGGLGLPMPAPAPMSPPSPDSVTASPRPRAADARGEPGMRPDGVRGVGGPGEAVPELPELAGEGSDVSAAGKRAKDERGGEGPLTARADFRSAVWWSPTLRVGADGTADLGPVPFADSLTRWRITARAVDAASRVGSSVTTVRTQKRVLTRVTLPRFLRKGDVVDAPWVLHSLLPGDAEARFVSGASGLTLSGPSQGTETLRAGAVVTHDLRLTAPAVGQGTVTAELRTAAGGDAVTETLPVLPQGISKTLAVAGFADGAPVTLAPLALPSDAEAGTARLRITVAPSYAQAVGAALPYLADYPYGCTEQTMSRLVPVVVAKAARDGFHVPLSGRMADLPKMLEAGLARLRTLQHADGGFGWWENDASDPYMTAYVVHGLTRAMEVAERPETIAEVREGAAAWLSAYVGRAGDGVDPVVYAFAEMALCEAGRVPAKGIPAIPGDGILSVEPLVRAFAVRARVAARIDPAASRTDIDTLKMRATRDATGVHWDGGRTGKWSEDPVEKTAWILGALLALDPRDKDLAPGARWLLSQRVGGDHWRSTRDTAACVAFLTRLAGTTGDLGAGRAVRLSINGVSLRSVLLTPETAFSDEATVTVGTADLPRGPIEVTAAPETGSASVSAALSFSEMGPAIGAADAGFRVARTWWLLTPLGSGYSRRPVTETVPSGSLIDVEVAVTTSEAREFVMVTSPFAAGYEPERDSGTSAYESALAAAARPDHLDVRDDRAVFFVKAMPAGTHVFRHRVRATHVGSFTALPAQAELMYFPEVRGNSGGEALEISKAGAAGALPGAK